HDHRQLDIRFPGRLDHASSQHVDARNAAKDIDEHGAHALVAQQNFKRVRDLVGAGAAAYVQKVGGQAARIFDDVHGGHRQAGAVHHAAHAAVELDVVEVVFRRLYFERIFLGDVAQLAEVRVTEERVIVKGQLGIEREQPPVGATDERIDFHEGCIRFQ